MLECGNMQNDEDCLVMSCAQIAQFIDAIVKPAVSSAEFETTNESTTHARGMEQVYSGRGR